MNDNIFRKVEIKEMKKKKIKQMTKKRYKTRDNEQKLDFSFF